MPWSLPSSKSGRSCMVGPLAVAEPGKATKLRVKTSKIQKKIQESGLQSVYWILKFHTMCSSPAIQRELKPRPFPPGTGPRPEAVPFRNEDSSHIPSFHRCAPEPHQNPMTSPHFIHTTRALLCYHLSVTLKLSQLPRKKSSERARLHMQNNFS